MEMKNVQEMGMPWPGIRYALPVVMDSGGPGPSAVADLVGGGGG